MRHTRIIPGGITEGVSGEIPEGVNEKMPQGVQRKSNSEIHFKTFKIKTYIFVLILFSIFVSAIFLL